MKLRLAVLLATMYLAAAAQRGSMPAGHMPGGSTPGGRMPGWKPSPSPGWRPSPGRGPWWSRRSPLTFYAPLYPWFGAAPCAGFAADPFFLPGACNPGYYPPAPMGNPMSDMAMPDQPPLLPPPPFLPLPPMGNDPTAAPEPPNPSQAGPPTDRQVNGREAFVSANQQAYQAPPPTPAVPEEYPALIVLKPGGMYSARKYWVKHKNLYFETTQGETLYAPLAMIDRLYPAYKQGQNAR